MQQIRSSQDSAQDILPVSGTTDSRSTTTSPFFNGFTSSHRPLPGQLILRDFRFESNLICFFFRFI